MTVGLLQDGIGYTSTSNPPVVTSVNFNLSLPASNGAFVGTVLATNSPTSWAITSGNSAGYFSITNVGTINVTAAGASGLSSGTYNLTVQATNAFGSGAGTVGVIATAAANAPVITTARPQSAVTSAFDISNNGSSTTNNFLLIGTSPANATIALYLDGSSTSIGPGWTVTANSSGNWSFFLSGGNFALPGLSDGAHTVVATATVAGVTSPQSSVFHFTVLPMMTNLPVAIGGNLSAPQTFTLGTDTFEVQNDSTNTTALIVVDTHTLHYTLRPQDNWNTFNRDEIASHNNFTNTQTLHATYEIMLDPAYGPYSDTQNGATAPVNVNQVHENNTTSTIPCLMAMMFGEHPNNPSGDMPTWQYDNGSGTQVWLDGSAVGLNSLARGVWHTVEWTLAMPTTTFQLWLNGTQYRNNSPCTGSGSGAPPYYFKCGLYRGSAGGHSETNGIFYRNIINKYT
jgi:hypothetical protein